MSYSKTTWVDGDKITSSKLNKIEDELVNLDERTPFLISFTIADNGGVMSITADKTFADVLDAYQAGMEIRSKIILPDGNINLFVPLSAVFNPEMPLAFLFTLIIDGSGSGEDPEMSYNTLVFSSVSITMEPVPLVTLPLEVTATRSNDGETITLNKTAGEIYAAAQAGRLCKTTVPNVPMGQDVTGTITMILPIEVFKIEAGGETFYTVKARGSASTNDTLLYGDGFAADDIVVLRNI